jgi:transcriptional regulator with GAF, ATPase, and Fis domain
MIDYESVRNYSGLQEEISALARKRITAALLLCGGNKNKAALLLGLPSYQTLSNWMKKHDVAVTGLDYESVRDYEEST